jgi:hypothetical protein
LAYRTAARDFQVTLVGQPVEVVSSHVGVDVEGGGNVVGSADSRTMR